MDIAKKNLVSILCGVVAIAAIVAWFWPVGSMYEALASEVNASKAKHDEVRMLHKADRSLPSLVLDPGAERPKLEQFPNEAIVRLGQEKTGQLTAQSKRMLETVTNVNKRDLAVPMSVPKPDGRVNFDFAEEYLIRMGEGPRGWEEGLPKELNATRPPGKEDIEEVADKIWESDYRKQVIRIGQKDNYQAIASDFLAGTADLTATEQKKRAGQHKIYLDFTSLPVNPSIGGEVGPSAPVIWCAQVGLWITEDVVKAINAANSRATNILDAPVKHLVSLRIPFGSEQYKLAGNLTSPTGEAAVLPVDANGVPEVFSVSPTGRVCGDLYDVVHFDLVLRVDFRKIPQIFTELERNRLFTVLSTSVASVDAAEEMNVNGYVYGKDPVAELTLQCEALFLRSWTVDKDNDYKNAIMPDVIQYVVGAKQAPGVQPGGFGQPSEFGGGLESNIPAGEQMDPGYR